MHKSTTQKHQIFIEKIIKIDKKNRRKRSWLQNLTKKRLLGRTFVKKNEFTSILGSLGCPLGRPWEGFRVINLKAQNMMKKRSGRWLPRRETRTPVKTLPRAFLRQDLTRLRSPGCRWAGGLFTLRASRRGIKRLRGLENLRSGEEDVYSG